MRSLSLLLIALMLIVLSGCTKYEEIGHDLSISCLKNTPTKIDALYYVGDKGEELFVISQPKHGLLVINEDKTVTYTPNKNYIGKDQFDARIKSKMYNYESNLFSVTITIKEDNKIPIAISDEITIYKNEVVTIPVLNNDFDEDNDPIHIISTSLYNYDDGSILISKNQEIIFTPPKDFIGEIQFLYTISDGINKCDGSVKINIIDK